MGIGVENNIGAPVGIKEFLGNNRMENISLYLQVYEVLGKTLGGFEEILDLYMMEVNEN